MIELGSVQVQGINQIAQLHIDKPGDVPEQFGEISKSLMLSNTVRLGETNQVNNTYTLSK